MKNFREEKGGIFKNVGVIVIGRIIKKDRDFSRSFDLYCLGVDKHIVMGIYLKQKGR